MPGGSPVIGTGTPDVAGDLPPPSGERTEGAREAPPYSVAGPRTSGTIDLAGSAGAPIVGAGRPGRSGRDRNVGPSTRDVVGSAILAIVLVSLIVILVVGNIPPT